MKPSKKTSRKLERRQRGYAAALTEVKRKAGFNSAAYKMPGSRNPHKT